MNSSRAVREFIVLFGVVWFLTIGSQTAQERLSNCIFGKYAIHPSVFHAELVFSSLLPDDRDGRRQGMLTLRLPRPFTSFSIAASAFLANGNYEDADFSNVRRQCRCGDEFFSTAHHVLKLS
jgi:hypothetical protein